MGVFEKSNEKERALVATIACAKASRECASACLEERDIDRFRNCIRLDRDCAWICDLTGAYLEANSSFQAQACRLCAEICDACAEECGYHKDMAHCRDCAAACRKCSEACLNFASAMV